jgi:hypothetical protein
LLCRSLYTCLRSIGQSCYSFPSWCFCVGAIFEGPIPRMLLVRNVPETLGSKPDLRCRESSRSWYAPRVAERRTQDCSLANPRRSTDIPGCGMDPACSALRASPRTPMSTSAPGYGMPPAEHATCQPLRSSSARTLLVMQTVFARAVTLQPRHGTCYVLPLVGQVPHHGFRARSAAADGGTSTLPSVALIGSTGSLIKGPGSTDIIHLPRF